MLEKGRKGTKEREEKGGYEDLRVIQKKNFILFLSIPAVDFI